MRDGDAAAPDTDDLGPPIDAASAFAVETDRATTVRSVRELWERMLPGQAVGVDVDFADLGGDSLLAAQMLVRLEREVGVVVTMGELIHARTVRQLAEVVRARRADGGARARTTALVQEGAPDRPRLWFLPDLHGSAYRVRHVARELGTDQPVWSFESPLLRGEPNPFRSLGAFAARYVADLQAEQPQGPYWLAGHSFGGLCAYEMARQLRSAGEEVAFVGVGVGDGIGDVGPGREGPGWGGRRSPPRPWFGVAPPPPVGSSVGQVVEHYRDMVRRSPARAARHLMVRSGVARVVDPFRFRADLRRHGRVRPEWRLWYAWEEHWRLAAHRWGPPHTFDGPVDLLGADGSSADPATGWASAATEVRVHRYPGDPAGPLEPRGAPTFAAALRTSLDAERSRRSTR